MDWFFFFCASHSVAVMGQEKITPLSPELTAAHSQDSNFTKFKPAKISTGFNVKLSPLM